MKVTVNHRNAGHGWMQVCEMMRDQVANDNMGAEARASMMAWAQARMHKPEWRVHAIMAMVEAQRR